MELQARAAGSNLTLEPFFCSHLARRALCDMRLAITFSRWIVAADLVVNAIAACPNHCSGHGECGNENVCVCDELWTAYPDCSGRACIDVSTTRSREPQVCARLQPLGQTKLTLRIAPMPSWNALASETAIETTCVGIVLWR